MQKGQRHQDIAMGLDSHVRGGKDLREQPLGRQRGHPPVFPPMIHIPPGNLANGAVYLLSPEFLQLARKRFFGATDFSTEILPALMGRIYTYTTHEVFIDIGTPQSYAEANQSEDPGYT